MARVPDGYQVEPITGRLVRITGRRMTQRQFMRRRPLIQQIALNAMRNDPAGDLWDRAALNVLVELRDMADEVNLDDEDTQFGAAYAINALTDLPEGHPARIAPGDAAAEVDAWLADFPQPGEPTT